MQRQWADVKVTPTTDLSLPTFDNTKLVAVNTCPTYALVTYTLNKRMHHGGRAMALEAGKAAHEVFAAHRLFHIREHGARAYRIDEGEANRLFRHKGTQLFGEDRFASMVEAINPAEDARTQQVAFSLTALYTGQFYDDPGDRRRTVTNIEEMCIAYMDKYDWSDQMPVVLPARNSNEEWFIGIEVPIDVTLHYTMHDGTGRDYRLIGRVDGVHWKDDRQADIRLHENKTASRLGDAWEASHLMSHQHTGYMIGLSTLMERDIRQGLVLGSALPLPKAYNVGGFSRVPVRREDFEVVSWFDWFLETVMLHDRYKDEPTEAPHYTHSCNRYYRPCPLIPFCASPPEDRGQMIEEMYDEEWSPLAESTEPTDE
jgi:PD-(D/E)XK nuclease superfamily